MERSMVQRPYRWIFFLTIIRMAEEHGKNWTQMPSEKRKHENNMEQQKNSEATEHEAQQIG